MAGTDKITRVLKMYSKLLEGGKIYKKSFCEDMEIDRRTFDRDIEDIRLFLSETFHENELIYDRQDESYHLKNYFRHKALSAMEVTGILECLKSCQNLQKDEYEGIIRSILAAGEQNKRKLLQKIAERYRRAYGQDGRKRATLKMLWDLEQCIAEQDLITISMKKQKIPRLAPVSLWVYEEETYLFAYEKEMLQVFAISDIDFFQMEHQKFPQVLLEQFDKLDRQTIIEEIEKEKVRYEENQISSGNEGRASGKRTGRIAGIF